MNTNFEIFDKKKVGKLIGWGGDHLVYEYGNDKVIKFSILERLMGKEGHKKTLEDFLTAKLFFGDYVLETDVLKSPNGKWSGAVQKKISGGHYLSKNDLKIPEIKKQFLEIVKAYKAMIAAGYPAVDLIGRGGILQAVLSNIFVTPQNKLLIFDITLFEIKNPGILKIFLYIFLKIALPVQNHRIESFIKFCGENIYYAK